MTQFRKGSSQIPCCGEGVTDHPAGGWHLGHCVQWVRESGLSEEVAVSFKSSQFSAEDEKVNNVYIMGKVQRRRGHLDLVGLED